MCTHKNLQPEKFVRGKLNELEYLIDMIIMSCKDL